MTKKHSSIWLTHIQFLQLVNLLRMHCNLSCLFVSEYVGMPLVKAAADCSYIAKPFLSFLPSAQNKHFSVSAVLDIGDSDT